MTSGNGNASPTQPRTALLTRLHLRYRFKRLTSWLLRRKKPSKVERWLAHPPSLLPTRTKSRRLLICKRWLAVAAIGVITLCACLAALWVSRERLHHVSYEWPAWLSLALATIAVFAWLLISSRRTAPLGAKHALTYPNYWLGMSVGIAAALQIAERGSLHGLWLQDAEFLWLRNTVLGLYLVPLLVVVTSCVRWVLRALVAWRRRYRAAHPEPSFAEKYGGWAGIDESLRIHRQEQLLKWAADDEPISAEGDDLFGYQTTAARMAERLSAQRASAQAVIGQLGVGKSSLRNLVHQALEARNRLGGTQVELVALELWPYETTRGAVEGVITKLVQALERQVSALRIRGLPEKYAALATAVTSSASVLPRLLPSAGTPVEALDAFDDIAICIDRKYVLWVEDLERFAPGTSDTPIRDISEAEKLAPIRALLHAIDRLQSTTVVTSTTHLFARFDLEKIARYVERLPPLDVEQVRSCLRSCRERWMERTIDYQDPVPYEARDHIGWRKPVIENVGLRMEVRTLADAVIALVDTPRILKQVIRSCEERWQRIGGEIDLDDMLAVTAIRDGCPDAFALLERDFDNLRLGLEGAMESFSTSLEKALQEVPKRRAVMKLVTLFFGKDKRPQGIAVKAHIDYWQRFLSWPRIDKSDSDQVIIVALQGVPVGTSAIQTLKTDPDEIATLLIERAPAIQHFQSLLTDEDLLAAFERLVVAVRNQGAFFRRHGDLPGIGSAWHIIKRRPYLDPQLHVVLKRCLEVAVSRSLMLMAELELFFLTSDAGSPDVFSAETQTSLREFMRQAVMVEYVGRPAALAEALQHADERTLYWIFYGIKGEDYSGDALPLPDWVEFRDTLLEGMVQSPRVMLRVMAPLVTTATGSKSTPWVFDESRASLLFTDLDLLLLLFGQRIDDGRSDRVTAVVDYGAQRENAAILIARQELEDRLSARVRELELASGADDVDG